MVYCAVRGCRMRSEVNCQDGIRFFSVPALRKNVPILSQRRYERRRSLWLSKIGKMDKMDCEKPIKICSLHFISGKPANSSDETSPDWVPSTHFVVSDAPHLLGVPVANAESERSHAVGSHQVGADDTEDQESNVKMEVQTPMVQVKIEEPEENENEMCGNCSPTRNSTNSDVNSFLDVVLETQSTVKIEEVKEEPEEINATDAVEDPWKVFIKEEPDCSEYNENEGLQTSADGKEEMISEYESDDQEIKPPATVFLAPYFEKEDHVKQDKDPLSKEVEEFPVTEENELDAASGGNQFGVESSENSLSGIMPKSCIKSGHSARKNSHAGLRVFHCHICQKGIKTKSNLLKHIERHSEERAYQCDICQKCFKTKFILLIHKMYHSEERAYQCDICQKGYKTTSDLSKHKKCHTEERAYPCDICEKSFKTSSDLSKHKKCHTKERAYQCDICQKGFKRKSNLSTHMICHTEEKAYHCDICEKGCKTKSDLTKHKMCHTKDRAYQCDICQKSYKTKNDLSKHMICHTEERAYQCDICQKSYKTKSDLSKHKKCHSGER